MWGSRSAPPSMRAMATAGSGPPPSSGCRGPVKPMMAGSRPGEWGQSPRMSRGKGQDALPRDHPVRPLGNAATKGRDGQGFTERPSLCCAPLLGRQRRGRREWAWGVQTCYAGGGPVGAGLGAYMPVTPAAGESGPTWSVHACYAGAGRPSPGPPGPAPGQCCNKGTGRAGFHRTPVPLLRPPPGPPASGTAGVGLGRTDLLRRRWTSRGRPGAYMTCYAGGAPLEAGVGSPSGEERRCGDGCGVGLQRGFSAPAGRPWNRIAAAQSQAAGWQFPPGRRGSNASQINYGTREESRDPSGSSLPVRDVGCVSSCER